MDFSLFLFISSEDRLFLYYGTKHLNITDFYCWSQILYSKHPTTRNRRNIWIVLQPSSESFDDSFSLFLYFPPLFWKFHICTKTLCNIRFFPSLFLIFLYRYNLSCNFGRACEIPKIAGMEAIKSFHKISI